MTAAATPPAPIPISAADLYVTRSLADGELFVDLVHHDVSVIDITEAPDSDGGTAA